MITQRLALLMGGDVGFTSEPGTGSVFWVDVPVESGPAAARTVSIDRATRAPVSHDRRIVLYVEDNPANVVFILDHVASTLEDL